MRELVINSAMSDENLKQIQIQTLGGVSLRLKPVAMGALPSRDSRHWHRFIGPALAGWVLSESEAHKLQAFMHLHHTDVVTDGRCNLTISGEDLRICFPEIFNKGQFDYE